MIDKYNIYWIDEVAHEGEVKTLLKTFTDFKLAEDYAFTYLKSGSVRIHNRFNDDAIYIGMNGDTIVIRKEIK